MPAPPQAVILAGPNGAGKNDRLERVDPGGHDVPEEIIRRRYDEGLRNFFQKYRWSVDEWQFLDNSDVQTKLVAASSILEGVRIVDSSLWSTLEERYAP